MAPYNDVLMEIDSLIATGVTKDIFATAGCKATLSMGLTSRAWYPLAMSHFRSGSKWPWLHDISMAELRSLCTCICRLSSSHGGCLLSTVSHMDYLLLRRLRLAPGVNRMMDDPESYDELFWLLLKEEFTAPEPNSAIKRLAYRERHRAILTENIELLTDNLAGNSAAAAAYGKKLKVVPMCIKLDAIKSNNKKIIAAIFPEGVGRRNLFVTHATEKELLDMADPRQQDKMLEYMAHVRPRDITSRLIAAMSAECMKNVVSIFCDKGALEQVKMCVARGYVLKKIQMRLLCCPHTICKENLLWLVESKHLSCMDQAVKWCIAAGRVDLVYWALQAGHIRDVGVVYICAVEIRCTELAEYVWPRSKRDETLAQMRTN